MGYEEQLLASQPFVFSRSPENAAHVGYPVRRIVRYTEERKAAIAESDERKRRYQEGLRAQRSMAKLTSAANADANAGAAVPLDVAELRSIVKTFEPYLADDREREELILVTTNHLKQLPGAGMAFQQFIKTLRRRKPNY